MKKNKLCEVIKIKVKSKSKSNYDRFCGLVVRVSGYITEMYRASCEVRTEFIYVKQKKVDRLCVLVVRIPNYRSRGPGSIPGATRFSEE
jgi:hypothetical protein